MFFSDADRRFFLSELGDALVAHGCTLHAYVLMTNHIHLLITPTRDEAVGRLMQSLGRRYVGYVNRGYARTGTLWEGRFKSTIVDAEDYVMACYRYIEANLLRARMVPDAGEYEWSSYGANATGRRDPLLTEHEIYRSLGATPQERQAAYRAGGAERRLAPCLARRHSAGMGSGKRTVSKANRGGAGSACGAAGQGKAAKAGGGEGWHWSANIILSARKMTLTSFPLSAPMIGEDPWQGTHQKPYNDAASQLLGLPCLNGC
jgi:REP element-mobilizing transposase RayT